jgi:hypothetical protein
VTARILAHGPATCTVHLVPHDAAIAICFVGRCTMGLLHALFTLIMTSFTCVRVRVLHTNRYHTFVGEITLGCGINGYETNEQIIHATSATPLGPWARDGPVKPFGSSAVCPHAQRSADGRWLIFHTGCGNHSDPNSEGYGTNHSLPITNCVNGTTPTHPQYGPPPPPLPSSPSSLPSSRGRDMSASSSPREELHEPRSRSPRAPSPPATCGVASDVTSVFVSQRPEGPWTQTRLRTNGAAAKRINGVPWPGCESHLDPNLCKVPDNLGGNPTALILPNGTTLLLFRTYYSNVTECKALGAVIRPTSGCVAFVL